MRLSSTPHSMMSAWSLEIGRDGSIYTMKIGSCYKTELLSPVQHVVKHLLAHHWGSVSTVQTSYTNSHGESAFQSYRIRWTGLGSLSLALISMILITMVIFIIKQPAAQEEAFQPKIRLYKEHLKEQGYYSTNLYLAATYMQSWLLKAREDVR